MTIPFNGDIWISHKPECRIISRLLRRKSAAKYDKVFVKLRYRLSNVIIYTVVNRRSEKREEKQRRVHTTQTSTGSYAVCVLDYVDRFA